MNIYASLLDWDTKTIEASILYNVEDGSYITRNSYSNYINRISLHDGLVEMCVTERNNLLIYCRSRNKLDQKLYELKEKYNLKLV